LLYVVIPTRKGNDGQIEFMLPHKPNGDCYYLSYVGGGRSKCSIWDHAPAACREFDCRKWWASFNPTQQEALLFDHLDSDVVLAAFDKTRSDGEVQSGVAPHRSAELDCRNIFILWGTLILAA
jgi:hypothetical protein